MMSCSNNRLDLIQIVGSGLVKNIELYVLLVDPWLNYDNIIKLF